MNEPKPSSRGIAFNFFSPLILLVGFLLAVPSFRTIYHVQSSSQWPQVDGRVISADLERRSFTMQDVPGQEYLARVWFGYEVGGKKYVSRNFQFEQSFSKDKAKMEAILARYPAGAVIRVRYFEQDPELAVVDPEVVPVAGVMKFGLAVLLILTGLVGTLGALFRGRDRDTY